MTDLTDSIDFLLKELEPVIIGVDTVKKASKKKKLKENISDLLEFALDIVDQLEKDNIFPENKGHLIRIITPLVNGTIKIDSKTADTLFLLYNELKRLKKNFKGEQALPKTPSLENDEDFEEAEEKLIEFIAEASEPESPRRSDEERHSPQSYPDLEPLEGVKGVDSDELDKIIEEREDQAKKQREKEEIKIIGEDVTKFTGPETKSELIDIKKRDFDATGTFNLSDIRPNKKKKEKKKDEGIIDKILDIPEIIEEKELELLKTISPEDSDAFDDLFSKLESKRRTIPDGSETILKPEELRLKFENTTKEKKHLIKRHFRKTHFTREAVKQKMIDDGHHHGFIEETAKLWIWSEMPPHDIFADLIDGKTVATTSISKEQAIRTLVKSLKRPDGKNSDPSDPEDEFAAKASLFAEDIYLMFPHFHRWMNMTTMKFLIKMGLPAKGVFKTLENIDKHGDEATDKLFNLVVKQLIKFGTNEVIKKGIEVFI